MRARLPANPESKPKSPELSPAGGAPGGGGLLLSARILLGVAVTMATYLAWISVSGERIVGCGPESGCERVLQSRWAYWLGLPVSLPAVGVYAALLGATFWTGGTHATNRQRWAWRLGMALASLIAGAALWFVGLQLLVLKSICKFCLVAHLSGLAGAVAVLVAAPRRLPGAEPARALSAVTGLVGLAVLIAGQVLFEPRQYQVESSGGQASAPGLSAGRGELVLQDGRVRLDLTELPVLGSPDAPHVVVSLFDYTCEHCRTMHGTWAETQRRFGGRLAIVSLPVPLSASCNDQLKATLPVYRDACDYARLGLAIWRADRGAFAKFDAWIFPQPKLPTIAVATQYAETLIGGPALQRALQDEWIDRQIRTNVALYADNCRRMQTLKMPQAIVGRAIVVGNIKLRGDLDRLLSEQFGLRPEG